MNTRVKLAADAARSRLHMQFVDARNILVVSAILMATTVLLAFADEPAMSFSTGIISFLILWPVYDILREWRDVISAGITATEKIARFD